MNNKSLIDALKAIRESIIKNQERHKMYFDPTIRAPKYDNSMYDNEEMYRDRIAQALEDIKQGKQYGYKGAAINFEGISKIYRISEGDLKAAYDAKRNPIVDKYEGDIFDIKLDTDTYFTYSENARRYGKTRRVSKERDPEVVYDEDGCPVISKEKLYTKEYNNIRKEQRDADLFKVLAIKMGQSKHNSSIVTVIRSKYKIIHRQSQGVHAVANFRAQKIFAKINNQ